MYDLSEFAKTLKQRFSQSYNRRHDRKGTLWEERFKSLILEGRGYEHGVERGVDEFGRAIRKGVAQTAVEKVRTEQGRLSRATLLRCRVRYFTDGVILGSRVFVDEQFSRYRDRFSAKRTSGARPMRGGAWGELYTARRLRLEVIGPPALG